MHSLVQSWSKDPGAVLANTVWATLKKKFCPVSQDLQSEVLLGKSHLVDSRQAVSGHHGHCAGDSRDRPMIQLMSAFSSALGTCSASKYQIPLAR